MTLRLGTLSKFGLAWHEADTLAARLQVISSASSLEGSKTRRYRDIGLSFLDACEIGINKYCSGLLRISRMGFLQDTR